MEIKHISQQIVDSHETQPQNKEWRTIGVKVRNGELQLLNRQLIL
jgi:hypothetical protein